MMIPLFTNKLVIKKDIPKISLVDLLKTNIEKVEAEKVAETKKNKEVYNKNDKAKASKV